MATVCVFVSGAREKEEEEQRKYHVIFRVCMIKKKTLPPLEYHNNVRRKSK